jgi:alpha-L-fucosidase
VLLAVGGWLKINGDAIYGTRPWTIYGEGPTKVKPGPFHDTETQPYTAEDFRFTTKGNDLFAIELAWPAAGETVIHALSTSSSSSALPAGSRIEAVHLLGTDAALTYTQQADGLHIQLPPKPQDQPAYALRVTFNSPVNPPTGKGSATAETKQPAAE